MRYNILNRLTGFRTVFLFLGFIALVAGCSEIRKAGLPAPAGVIDGPSEIVEGTSIELRVEKIDNADIYRWYRNGRFLSDTDNGCLITGLEGNYSVMGVNGLGEGAVSPEKTVSLKPDLNIFINRLVGKWDVREYIVIKEGEIDKIYNNDHIVTITKIDNETISISNFCEANADPENEVNGDTVVAVVDNDNETIRIPVSWKFTPTWYKGLDTELCPTINEKFGENVGLPFPEQHFETVETEGGTRLRMTMKTGDLVAEVGGVVMNHTYIIALTHEGQYSGHFAYFIGTEWTKMD